MKTFSIVGSVAALVGAPNAIVRADSSHSAKHANISCVSITALREEKSIIAGKETAVCGVVSFRLEDVNLYSSMSSATKHDKRNCLSLSYSQNLQSVLHKSDHKKVIVSGRYVGRICPDDTLCLASCSTDGISIDAVTAG